jgi:protein O-GlcNAc transferase
MINKNKQQQVDALMRARDIAAAFAAVIEMVRGAPRDLETLVFAANVAVEAQRPADVLALCNAIAAVSPNHIEATLFAAAAHRLNRDFARAEHLLQIDAKKAKLSLALEGRRLRELGLTYLANSRLAEASRALTRASALRPADAQLLCELGYVLEGTGEPERAHALFQRAYKLRPDYYLAIRNVASSEINIGKVEAAFEFADRAHQLDPAEPENAANWLLAATSHPGVAAERLRDMHMEYASKVLPAGTYARPPANAEKSVLSIGYFSHHLRRFPLSSFVPHVMAAHDRNRVKVYALSTSPLHDEWTREYVDAADEFHDFSSYSDVEIASRIRSLGIDVLVDLSGYTAQNRCGVLARRPAPIQMSWLGYLVTYGTPAIDYHLTDAWANPPGQTEHLYTEKLIRLPGSQYCYRPLVDVPLVTQTPYARNGHITFGAFSIASKWNQSLLDAFAQVLLAVPDSKLQALAISRDMQTYVRTALVERGVDKHRIGFFGRRDLAGYLVGIGEVDVVLDAFPFVGGTTVFDALWMGVPVVSMWLPRGFGGAARSVLRQVGLSNLVANSPEEYVKVAAAISADHGQREVLRQALRSRLKESGQLSPKQMATSLERAFQRAWEGLAKGEQPVGFDVEPVTD